MMLLDGYHNKKRYGSIQASERKIFDHNAVAELKTTIKHDISTCLTRVVASIKQTKDSSQSANSVKRDSSGSVDSYKSTLDRVLNDQFLGTRSLQGGGHLHQRSKSVKQLAHQRWIPSVKGNLTRSFSVQQRKIDTSKLKLRYQLSSDTCNSYEKGNRANFRSDAGAHRSNKTDSSWSFGINKFSVASLLPIVAYLTLITIPISVISAPVPQKQQQPNGVHPIWLNEGLINLDRGLEGELEPSFFQTEQNYGDSALDQALLNILTEKEQRQEQQTEGNLLTETFGRRILKPTWSPFGHEVLEDANPTEAQAPSADQLWVQRRRLDRNRALEPPPWMREQPMRRGYNPLLSSESGNLRSADEEQEQDLNSVSVLDSALRPIPGRKLRQSSDEIYDEVLKYLIEEAFQGQDFINEIYDELERKSKANPQSGLKLTIDGSPQLQPLHQQQQQQRISNQQNAKSPIIVDDSQGLDQGSDPNSALIVVGDEVSSGDGPASVVEPAQSNSDIKATYVQVPPGSEQPSTSVRDDLMDIMSQQQRMRQQTSAPVSPDQYGTPVRYENSPYTLETPVIMDAESQSRYSTLSNQEPFHVLEEIDQIDDSQSAPAPQPPQQQLSQIDVGDNSAAQSSQFVDWLSTGTSGGDSELDSSEQLLPSKRDPGSSSVFPTSGDSLSSINYGGDPAKWFAQQAAARGMLRKSAKAGIALRMIESDYLSREQLEQVATKLKSHLEDMIGLMDGSILDLYPLNPQQLLIKLDTSKLSALQIMDMIQKYDFARGFILISWPKGSPSNPVPILVAISNELTRKNSNGNVRPTMDVAKNQPENGDNSLIDTTDDIRSGRVAAAAAAMDEDDQLLAAATPTAGAGGMGIMDDDDDNYAAMGQRRIPLAALTALLSAIYANQNQRTGGFVEPLPVLMGPPSSQALLAADDQQHKALMSGPHLIQFSAIALALVGAFVAVKLVMKGQDSRMLLRRNLSQSSRSLRSFWSFGGDAGSVDEQLCERDVRSSELKVDSPATYAEKCKAANPVSNHRHHLATETDSLLDGSSEAANTTEHRKRNLEQLSRRLVSILSGFSHRHAANSSADTEKTDLEVGGKELSTDSSTSKSNSGVSEDEPQQQQTPYRSSRSYIKSLIDVLSKARPFSSGAGCELDEPDSSKEAALCDGESNPISASRKGKAGAAASDSSDDGGLDHGVLLSQMDITAAHLILSYMESHLDDKERLRREWNQLNGGAAANSNSSSSFASGSGSASSYARPKGSANGKMSEPILQRMAKVALSEENRPKNRDASVVAFDRNRVRLNPGQQQQQQRRTSPPAKIQQRTPSTNSTSSLANPPSDYINASFIYDDDPSRPTHIIAQGPLDQTTGHFWQMIWEQGISVIVMLTRLNENSARQCHCYWPTGTGGSRGLNSGGTPALGAGQQSGPVGNVSPPTPPSQSLDDAAPSSTNGDAKQQSAVGHGNETTSSASAVTRKGSVTSVFNMAAAGRAGQKGQPIIGNKELLSNVISFDVCSVVAADSLSASSSTSEFTAAAGQAAPPDSDSCDLDQTAANSGGGGGGGWHKSSKSKRRQEAAAAAARNRQQQQQQQQQQPQTTTTTKVIRFEVHLVSEHVSSNDYLVRNMCLVNRSTGETRTITQFHYLNWPDGGVPDNVKNLLQFRRKVHKSYRNLKSPILVHCSDGAGRSGTYTLIDIILERIRNGAKEIDPMATLVHLRQQRVGLCANLSQFEFVLMALAEEIQIILDALPQ